MDELIEQAMAKNLWPFKFHYTEDGKVIEKEPPTPEPFEEAPF